MGAGVEELRGKRGEEHVTFADVADHLADYADRHPGDRPAVERLARLLATVEDADHDRYAGRGLPPGDSTA